MSVVKEAREKAGLKRAELSERLGVTVQALGALERRGERASLALVRRAVEACGCELKIIVTVGGECAFSSGRKSIVQLTREHVGLTRSELAQRLGQHRVTLIDLEARGERASVATVRRAIVACRGTLTIAAHFCKKACAGENPRLRCGYRSHGATRRMRQLAFSSIISR